MKTFELLQCFFTEHSTLYAEVLLTETTFYNTFYDISTVDRKNENGYQKNEVESIMQWQEGNTRCESKMS